MRTPYALVLALALSAGAAGAEAAPCHDVKGKFIKCPVAAPLPPASKCRDVRGKFMKCKPAGPAAMFKVQKPGTIITPPAR